MVIVVVATTELVAFAGVGFGSRQQFITFPFFQCFLDSSTRTYVNVDAVILKKVDCLSPESGTNHDVYSFLSKQVGREASSAFVGTLVWDYFHVFRITIHYRVRWHPSEMFSNFSVDSTIIFRGKTDPHSFTIPF